MKLFFTRRERLAGLFLLVAALLVVVFVVGAAVRNRWLVPRVPFLTLVERGDGLREGSPVLLSGVEVGAVGRVAIRDDGRVEVGLDLLSPHAARLREGTRAVVRRLVGVGEKRIHLVAGAAAGRPLAAGSLLPADEPLDLVDLIGSADLGHLVNAADRTAAALDRLAASFGDPARIDRLTATVDRLGPLVEKADRLLGDPTLAGTLRGFDTQLNRPETTSALRRAERLLEPERVDRLLARTEEVAGRLEALLAPEGHLASTLEGSDRWLHDGRLERLVDHLERLTDEGRLARLVDRLTELTEASVAVAPRIPGLADDLSATLREALVVLRAVQETWLLEAASRRARAAAQAAPPQN